MILAIDPGPEQSAYVVYNEDTGGILEFGKHENRLIAGIVSVGAGVGCDRLAVEMIASYGMPVGTEVFETCVVIGRLIQSWSSHASEPERVTRIQAKTHLCHSAKATDANVRQALIDRYGPGKDKAIGLKASPGPLYGMNVDCRSALAVAITAAERTSC